MFFKNLSNITVIFFIILLCNTPSRINGMDNILKQIGGLINSTLNSIVISTLQADDDQLEKEIFYYFNKPVTERSFNQLRKIAFEVYFDKSVATETDNTSQELTESLYNTWEDLFHKEHAQTTLETTTALAKIVKHYITVDHTAAQKIVAIEYNDITAEFTDGMALLLYDIEQANRKPYDLDKKGKKIQW